MPSDPLTLEVRGIPKPGGSKKAMHHKHTGRIVVMDTSGKTGRRWRSDCKTAAILAMGSRPPLDTALFVSITFRMPRPKKHYTKKGLRPDAPVYHTSKPDTTKLFRSIEDALTGIVWKDDSLICRQFAEKVYSDTPGAVVGVEEVRT